MEIHADITALLSDLDTTSTGTAAAVGTLKTAVLQLAEVAEPERDS